MSKIKKALERSTALRQQNISSLALLEREQPASPEPKRLGLSESEVQGLSDRERLEYDIYALLRKEHPESLGHMKKQIKLSYSRTRIIQTDDEILRRNRVFATQKKHKSQFLSKRQNF